jgi:hypothetical protein
MPRGDQHRKDEQLIVALMSTATLSQAAAKAGVSERTVNLRLKDPQFCAAYRQARRDAVAVATGLLMKASAQAVAVLVSLMTDRETPAAVRIAAARTVLEQSFRACELEDIDARLTAIERMNELERFFGNG